METDLSRLDKLLSIADETLKPRLEVVLSALQVDAEKKEKILADLPKLRRRAKTLTSADIEAVRAALGDAFFEHLFSELERDRGGS